jgi:predicted O-methyltransferase YrrM
MLMNRNVFHSEYLSIIDPLDARWKYENYEAGLWVKHQIAHYVEPRTIVEIGVRSGYSMWAMMKAAPTARFYGYDNYSPDYAKELGDNLSEQFKAWAGRVKDMLYGQAELIVEDSQSPGFMPKGADLYHVDGDHRTDPAFFDIRNCMAASFGCVVIAVHDYMAQPVRDAVAKARAGTHYKCYEVIEERNGDAILFPNEVPEWVGRIETK